MQNIIKLNIKIYFEKSFGWLVTVILVKQNKREKHQDLPRNNVFQSGTEQNTSNTKSVETQLYVKQ